MTTQGDDAFQSGYSLGGDPHQLGPAGVEDPGLQYRAALTVVSREDMSAGERRELLDMLGLAKVASRRRPPGRAGAA